MDPPEHPRYRRIFQKAFLPQTVAKWGESVVDPVVNDLMDEVPWPRRPPTSCRNSRCITRSRSSTASSRLPPEEAPTFHKLAIAQTVVILRRAARHRGLAQARRLLQGAGRRATAHIPATICVSVLAQAEVDGERLPEEIMISFLRQLVNAGGDTTYRGTSVLLTGLLSNPEQLEAVRKDRSLVPQAIEEALRWDGPVLIQTRMAAKDIELGGVRIPKGAVLDVAAGAANRDPARFPNPDKFDIFRKPQHKHFAFAYGPHVCIGQHLARVEMTRALNAILDHLPNLRLDPDKPAPEIRGIMMRVPKHLHVRFDA